jgi:hypothetical protein
MDRLVAATPKFYVTMGASSDHADAFVATHLGKSLGPLGTGDFREVRRYFGIHRSLNL